MVFLNCPIQFLNTLDHKVIAKRSLMNPCLDNVSSTCCGDVVNDHRSFQGNSCWFLKKLLKTDQLIGTCHVFSIIIYELIILSPCEITVYVTKEDHFLTFRIQVGKDFSRLSKEPIWSLVGQYHAITKKGLLYGGSISTYMNSSPSVGMSSWGLKFTESLIYMEIPPPWHVLSRSIYSYPEAFVISLGTELSNIVSFSARMWIPNLFVISWTSSRWLTKAINAQGSNCHTLLKY